MTTDNLATLADGVFASMRGYVQRTLDPLLARLAAVEQRTPLPGDKGADGRDGKDADPEQVKALVDAAVRLMLPGLVQRALDAAQPDIVARAAALVPRPADGRDGRDGAAGLPGRDGEKGADGIDGRDGRDGADGFGPDDLELSLDGRLLTIGLVHGERTVKRQVVLSGMPIYVGIFKGDRLYVADDMVTYGGSMWRAKRDTTEPPKGQSDDWQLVVKGGK